MRQKVLAVYPHRCTGCRLCEQWCSWQHHGAVNPARSRVTVHRNHHRHLNIPVTCSQCVKAPCVAVCPENAITRDPATGGLLLDADKCIGCRLCLEICPRGCIKMDAGAGVPLLCDLCGGDPQCVEHCPEGAILYLELDQVDQGYRVHRLAEAEEASP
ncbi:MAG: 4Fe-4S dicluster domain-containing protein [Chloroflexi bacterium]|nr:4Fe-4S dicluster domain-containing protein [Chloroflexota bacterium]MBU1748932.1 4Fe-4S dicluster domain-containing protein [Chloroflexota bacterium]